MPFPILFGTTVTTVLHYRADCDKLAKGVGSIAWFVGGALPDLERYCMKPDEDVCCCGFGESFLHPTLTRKHTLRLIKNTPDSF